MENESGFIGFIEEMRAIGSNGTFAVATGLILLAGCRTLDDSLKTDIARLNHILGVTGRNYAFHLDPQEALIVTFHAQKNGVDERDDTFTRIVDFKAYQQFNRNYPSFDVLQGERRVDVEILAPGHTWNPDQIKVSVRLPGFERYFYYDKPVQSTTRLAEVRLITRKERNTLLELTYRQNSGDTRTLTVTAEIRSKDRTTPTPLEPTPRR